MLMGGDAIKENGASTGDGVISSRGGIWVIA